jgi:hypothetical protein
VRQVLTVSKAELLRREEAEKKANEGKEVNADPMIHQWNCGLGVAKTRQIFFESDESAMSSFLRSGQEGWVKNIHETEVDVQTRRTAD